MVIDRGCISTFQFHGRFIPLYPQTDKCLTSVGRILIIIKLWLGFESRAAESGLKIYM